MWALIASSLVCFAVAADDRLPIPDWASQLRAEAAIRDVFGRQMDAARDPKQKSALAREILSVVRAETDHANKFVGLATARRLAIEAKDGALAIEVLAVQVASFASESEADPDAMLDKAESLWNEAERKRGSERLAQRLEAVEAWMRAERESPLLAAKWNDRIAMIKSGGAVVLKAQDAVVHSLRATYVSDFDAICHWRNPREYFEWKETIAAGDYYIEVTYSGFGTSVTTHYACELFRNSARQSSSRIIFRLDSSGSWRDYRTMRVGVVRIPDNEHMRIVFQAMATAPQDFINLRSVALVPRE